MGKWQGELNKILSQSQKDAKSFNEETAKFEKMVAAAGALSSAYSKFAPKIGKSIAALMETAEECGRAAAELSVYEDDYDKAKKKKDKDGMKKAEAKMKPLIKSFENGKKGNRKAAQDGNKDYHDFLKSVEALSKSLA